MKTLILAGGMSNRVPNKLMLQQLNGKPVFMSSLGLTTALGLDYHFLASSYMAKVLENFGIIPRKIIVDNVDHIGIVEAIDPLLADDDVMVLCADNIYGQVTYDEAYNVIRSFGEDHTSKVFCSLVLEPELDGVLSLENIVPGTFAVVRRGNPMNWSLRSPWFLTKGSIFNNKTASMSVISYLNEKKVKPVVVEDPEWVDMGTEKSVRDYYLSRSVSSEV